MVKPKPPSEAPHEVPSDRSTAAAWVPVGPDPGDTLQPYSGVMLGPPEGEQGHFPAPPPPPPVLLRRSVLGGAALPGGQAAMPTVRARPRQLADDDPDPGIQTAIIVGVGITLMLLTLLGMALIAWFERGQIAQLFHH